MSDATLAQRLRRAFAQWKPSDFARFSPTEVELQDAIEASADRLDALEGLVQRARVLIGEVNQNLCLPTETVYDQWLADAEPR